MEDDPGLPELRSPLLASRILEIRGRRVLLAADLAELYGVPRKRLHEQVRRNPGRFPEEFCFRLTRAEIQGVAAKCGPSRNLLRGKGLPLAFTEYGALMAATVLRSARAEEMSVLVVRAFVRIHAILAGGREVAARVEDLEKLVAEHDAALRGIDAALGDLMEDPPEEDRPRIGFRPGAGADAG
jgi:hypothetical protein